MSNITATSLIEFSKNTAADHLSVAVDDRPDGYNNGMTSFRKDSLESDGQPVFLVWCSIDNFVVECASGEAWLLSAAVLTRHDQDVMEYFQPGAKTMEIILSKPAKGMPDTIWVKAPQGIAIMPGHSLSDGSLGSVILQRNEDNKANGAWLIGKMKWVAMASAWRINPSAGAEQVSLLVSAGDA